MRKLLMNSKFINNTTQTLKEISDKIIDSTNNLYFLVGFFYFGGFELITEKIKDKKIKVLIGLDAEKIIKKSVCEFHVLEKKNESRIDMRNRTYDSIVNIFNETDYFDNNKRTESFLLFLNKIKDGTLEIKKTANPNHAKLYLFEKKPEYSENGLNPGVVITGSSNFSRPGFEGQYEINVILRDRDDYIYAKEEIFDNLWETAVSIADEKTVDKFYSEVVEKLWLKKYPKPYLLYIRALQEYFSIDNEQRIKLPSQIAGDTYMNLRYQSDAIVQGLSVLEKHNGVIIADVVGLGKSIIASAIAHNMNLHTIIIAPPHLRIQWEEYRQIFDYNAVVYTSGTIERALEDHGKSSDKLIIIDEAHKYRNELTDDYANLHRLCAGNKVIMLTATPFNNKPQDIFALIHLFQIPGKSTLTHIDNLSQRFRELVLEYKKVQDDRRQNRKTEDELKRELEEIADEIRNIIYPVVIRRSRIDLSLIDEYKNDLQAQGIDFPNVEPPIEIDYDLGDITELYTNTLEEIASDEEGRGFIGTRYKPTEYVTDAEELKRIVSDEFDDDTMINLFQQSQANIAVFMRKLLVRRFESSVKAFECSLLSLINSSKKVYDYYSNFGKVPIYKKGNLPDYDSLLSDYDDDQVIDYDELIEAGVFNKHFAKGLIFLDKEILSEKYISDLSRDIELLQSIYNRWFGDKNPPDPKLDSLKQRISINLKENQDRKIVVFTEFADTADYIYEKLKEEFKVFKYSSREANEGNKRIIRENFDAAFRVQKNDYDILIATDAISEGFNLHRAGIIINYDIPYNPTRVIQRVGRINRINKKVFDTLNIYNFFPSATGEEEISTKIISSLKIFMIHTLLGEDTRVLSTDEEPASYFTLLYDEYKKQFKSELEETTPSWEVEHRNYLSSMKRNNPDVIEEACNLPKRVRIRRKKELKDRGVVVFGKKGNEYTFKLCDDDNVVKIFSPWDALDLFKADEEEESFPESDSFEKSYKHVKEQLFSKTFSLPGDKGFKESVDIIRTLLKKSESNKDYLHDLLFVMEKLYALSEKHLKIIRNSIKQKKIDNESIVVEIMKNIPQDYLSKLINVANDIDEGEETLILTEELRP